MTEEKQRSERERDKEREEKEREREREVRERVINPNRKSTTPHLEDNLVIIKNPKRTRVCL